MEPKAIQPEGTPLPSAGEPATDDVRAERAESRDAMLSELAALAGDAAKAEESATASDDAQPDADAAAAPAKAAKEEAADAQKSDGSKGAKTTEIDPETAKRIEAAHRVEKRGKEELAKERQSLAAEKAEWTQRLAAVKEIEAIKARAKIDPAGALKALGVELSEYVARQVYLHSPEVLAKHPELAEQAQRALREQETATVASEARKELDALRAQLAEERQRAESERRVNAYVAEALGAVGDETPIVKAMVAKSPDRARQLMREVADYLATENEEIPTPGQVVQALEQWRRAELEADGVDLTRVLTPPSKSEALPAGEKKTAKTLGNDLTTPTPTRSAPLSRDELLADTRRRLEEGRLE